MLLKDFKPVTHRVCTLWTMWDIFLFPLLSEQMIEYKNIQAAAAQDKIEDLVFYFLKKMFCVLLMLRRCLAFGFLTLRQNKVLELDFGRILE